MATLKKVLRDHQRFWILRTAEQMDDDDGDELGALRGVADAHRLRHPQCRLHTLRMESGYHGLGRLTRMSLTWTS